MPAVSTVGDIQKREDLIEVRWHWRHPVEQGQIIAGSHELNIEWAIDLSGCFRRCSGLWADPLMVPPNCSLVMSRAC